MRRRANGGVCISACFALATIAGSGCKKSKDDRRSETPQTVVPTAPRAIDASSPSNDAPARVVLAPAPQLWPAPLGLPEAPSPGFNPTDANKVALGELLFYDPRLSGGKLACVSCHAPEHAWSSLEALRTTAKGERNQRHTPSLWNLAFHVDFYWDGRATPLESQILGHWAGQLGSEPAAVCAELAMNPTYRAHFDRSFAGEISPNRAAEALAAFLRNLRSGDSPWDRYEAGDANAVSEDVKAGAKIFNERAGCATCHAPPLYTDLLYHRIVALDDSDPGRALVTGRPEDQAAFKTPTLREVVHSAPYFHDGSAATLDDVLDRKQASGTPVLSAEERASLLLFLAALSSQSEPEPAPTLP